MKKFVVLITALIVVALTFGAAAEKTPYWEGFLDTAQIGQFQGHGEFGYYVTLMEYLNGQALNDGFENLLFLNYGIAPKTQFETNLSASQGYLELMGKVKHQFINTSDFAFAVAGRLIYTNYNGFGDELTPAVTVLFDNVLTNKVKLHNHLDFAFTPGGNLAITMQNGLTYVINPKNIVKVKLDSTFDGNDDIVLSAAYKAMLTDKFAYVLSLRKNFESANTRFDNIVEFKATPSLKLTGTMRLNTNYASRIIVRADHNITKNFSMNAEYGKDLRHNGYNYLQAGLNVKF